MILSKSHLVQEIITRSGLNKSDSEKALSAFLESILHALKNGEEIRLTGFGSFLSVEQDERVARNPKTGEKIIIPKKRVPKFKPSSFMKSIVNENSIKESEDSKDLEEDSSTECDSEEELSII